MMGLESDPKDGKVVAGSIFWAVLVYTVRLSSSLPPFFLFWWPPSPTPPLPPPKLNMPGVLVKIKKTRSNSDGVEIRFSSCFVGFKQFYITERVSGGPYR